MAEEGIDSGVNGGGQTPEKWMTEHASIVLPEYREEFSGSMLKDDTANFLAPETWQHKYRGGYAYVYSPDPQQVSSRTLTVTDVWLSAPVSIGGQSRRELGHASRAHRWQGLRGMQTSKGTMAFAVVKSAESGEWQINGSLHDVDTTEG